jgi:carbon storage regulator
MLVLSRRIGEEIVIGDDIRVTILSIKGKQIRLGIMAPLTVSVARMELLTRTPLRCQRLGESSASDEAGA